MDARFAGKLRVPRREAEREHADLIVIGSCHRGTVGRVLLGDVSRATLHGAPCPVAVAPHGYRDHDDQPVHTIGVGFNATDESGAALDFAVSLARDITGELRVLTALPASPSPATAYAHSFAWTENDAANRRAARQELAEATENVEVAVQTETVEASPGVALESLSERVDLIVAGSRGWGATRRVVLGSTTDRLAHHAHCPVIVVPSPVTDTQDARPGLAPSTREAVVS